MQNSTLRFNFLTFICIFLFFIGVTINAQVKNTNQQAQIEVTAAEKLYYDGKYAEAVKAYKAILDKYAKFNSKDSVRTHLGRCYEKLGDDNLAIQIYQDVIADNPDGPYAASAVSMIGNLHVQRYQYKQATAALQQIAAKYPNTRAAAMARYLIPMYWYSQGMADKAIEGYKSFLQDFPQSTYRRSALSSLISLYLRHNRFDEAEQALMESMGGNPQDVDMMRRLASVYQKKGQYDEALKLYQAALAKNPNDTNLLEQLGKFYLEQGEKDKALAEWSKLLKTSRGSPAANSYYQYQRLGNILKEHGFYAEAIAQYEEAIKLQPNVSYLYTQLADVYKIQGKMDEAISTYLRALSKLGVGYRARDNIISKMSELYADERQHQLFEKAITQLKTQLARQPQDANVILSLAEIYFHQGDFNASLTQFIQLARQYNDQGRLLNQYAQILERDNNYAAALAFYDAIFRLFPRSQYGLPARLRSGQLHYQLKQWDNALEKLRALIQQDINKQFTTDAYLLIGEIQLRGQRDVRAAASTYATLERMPYAVSRKNQIQLRVAVCNTLLGNYADAESILRSITDKPIAHERLGEYGIEAHKLLGDCYFFQGKFTDATAEYQQVVDASSNNVWNNDALAMIALIKENTDYFQQPLSIYAEALRLGLKGDYDAALLNYNLILEQFPKSQISDDAILAIGNLYRRQKQIQQAIASYEQLAQLDSPLAPEAQVKIGDVYRQELHETARAIDAYSNLIQKYPDSVLSTYARSQIREMNED